MLTTPLPRRPNNASEGGNLQFTPPLSYNHKQHCEYVEIWACVLGHARIHGVFLNRSIDRRIFSMANKVYWKGLRLFATGTKRYIERNQLGLEQNLTAPQYACVQDLLQAILSCLNILPSNPPE